MSRGSEDRWTEEQPADETVRSSANPVPEIILRTTTRFGWRHANGIAVIRFLVAVWLVCLGVIFCAFGDWWGAFLFVAAGLVGWLAYQMPRWKAALDAKGTTGTIQTGGGSGPSR
jgi:hypothetical protein